MAYTDKCLKDPEYTYWVRSGLALNITHEVLRPLVVKEITKLHQSIVKKLPPGVSCGGCSVNPGCPNGICDKIQREIENKHWYSNPSFTNTCTGRWSTEPWEIAKCYMPPIPGYRHSSASDADFSACINVIINCKHFQAFGTSDPNIKETVYSKSRDFRNRVMHASPRKVTENDMRENLDILIDILNKIKTPETEDDTKEAIAKIQKTIQMKINIGDAIEMGKNATEASADKPEKDEDQVQRERMIANFEAGCRKALCRITEEHISKQKRNLSVAAFLSKIEILAVIKNLCSKHKEILFPEYGTHEDIGEWDLFVYCFILEELDLSEPLENAVIRFVHEVKKIRNNLLLDATGKTQDDLSELCNYLIDTDLNTEITDIFNKVSPDVDVIRSYNSLVSWWRQEEEYGNKQDIQPIPGLGKDSMVVDDGSDILVKSGKPSLSLHEETDIKTEEERTKEENQFKVEENLKHIRLMVLGMFGVGKTCLVTRLQNEEIDDVRSTVGIEINVNVCEINEDDGCWTKSEGVYDSDIDGRVNDVLLNTTLDQQDSEPVKRTKRAKPVNKKKIPEPAENPHFRKPSPPKEPKPGQIEENREVKAISILKKEEGTDKKISRFVKRPIASGRKPTVSLWDFAGQSVYYSTHHFFLSSRSIYVLVLDISKRLDEEVDERYECFENLQGSMKKYTGLDAFKFWVTSIYAYTQYQNMNEDKGGRNQPTIVLVGTHGDKLEVREKGKDKEKQKDDYFEKAIESFNKPIKKMFHKKSFLVSCTEDKDTVFNEIKVEIYKIAKAQTYWNEGTPAKWLPLERSIEQKKKSKNKLMKFDDVKEADAGNELKLHDKDEIKLFLRMQHFLGKVMYFNANGLDDTVILDPHWLIDIFKLFVNHRPFLGFPPEIQGLWKEYKRTAKLTQPLLDYLIDHSAKTTEGKENQFKENKMQVVGYMEHLDVIAKPVCPKPQVDSEATNPKEIESNKDEEFYFVPCMLKQLTAAEENDHDVVRQLLNLENPVTGISTPVLCFVFDCKCMPPSIFHRLLATYIKKLPIKQQSRGYIIYNDFGAFKLDRNQTLCIWYTEFIIFARVKLHDSLDGVLCTDECIALRKELKDTLLSILLIDQQNHPQKRYVKGAFTEYVMCERLFEKYPPKFPQSKNSCDAMDGLHEVTKFKEIEPKKEYCTCSIAGQTDHIISSVKALEYWYKEP